MGIARLLMIDTCSMVRAELNDFVVASRFQTLFCSAYVFIKFKKKIGTV